MLPFLQSSGIVEEVSRKEVLRHWIRLEACEEPEQNITETDDERDLLEILVDQTDGASHHLWNPEPVAWYRCRLSESQLRNLRVIESPDGIGWDALTEDESVISAAQTIAQETVPPKATAAVDLTKVREKAREYPTNSVERIILVTPQTLASPRIVDGNHRATAVALALLSGVRYDPVEAYLGIAPRSQCNIISHLRWKIRYIFGGQM